MADKWYNDSDKLRGLANALAEAGVLEDQSDFQEFNKHPYRYDAAYQAWEDNGYPDADDENWDTFVEAITADDTEDDEEEEEEEEESS